MVTPASCPSERIPAAGGPARPDPAIARVRPSAPAALTDDQRRFAAEHHNLIYSYLKECNADVDEFYDIAAFGYLRAVKRYLTEPSLLRYRFSTIAWRAMKQNISAFRKAEERRKEAESRYLSTVRPRPPDLFEQLEAELLLHDLAAVSDDEQYLLASMRLQGYSIAEIARAQGMRPRRVRKLIHALYRAYLHLYE